MTQPTEKPTRRLAPADVVALLGVLLVFVGLCLIHVPAALIVLGLSLVGLAVLLAKPWASSAEDAAPEKAEE